jgi:hypothetical protein
MDHTCMHSDSPPLYTVSLSFQRTHAQLTNKSNLPHLTCYGLAMVRLTTRTMLSDWSLHAPSHTLALHISHALCVVLTFILLLLGGLTGPQTGYWWLVLTVSAGGQTAGEQWRVGGLGNCLAGEG